MSGDTGGKTARKRAIAIAENDYHAALALAKAAREKAMADAAAAETEAAGRATAALESSQRLLDEAVDSVERKLRQTALAGVRDEQSRLLSAAVRVRKQAAALARENEKKAIDLAESVLKAAVLQAMREEVESKKSPSAGAAPIPAVAGAQMPGSVPSIPKAEFESITRDLARLHERLALPMNAAALKENEMTDTAGAGAEPKPLPAPVEESNSESSTIGDAALPSIKADSAGRIRIGVSGSATAKQLFDLESALRSWPGIKLIMTIGGGSDTVYYVKTQDPSRLSAQFRALPCVAGVVPADGGLSVLLKNDVRACSA